MREGHSLAPPSIWSSEFYKNHKIIRGELLRARPGDFMSVSNSQKDNHLIENDDLASGGRSPVASIYRQSATGRDECVSSL